MTDTAGQIAELLREQEAQMQNLEYRLEESLARKVLELEDIGWSRLTGQDEDNGGLTLKSLHDLTPNLRDMAATNPWLVRGAQLRHAYVFGRGINFEGIDPKTQAAIDDFHNQAALFSVQAHETNNLAMFTDGNFFIVRDNANMLTVIPVSQITAEVTDPDDSSRVRYFLREWTSTDANNRPVVRRRWYPVSRYKKSQVGRGKRGKINKTIKIADKAIPVAQDAVIYHHASKRQTGWTYGVPQSLAATVWVVAYAEYLRDNASLVKALQQIAWSITTATKKGNANAAVSMSKPGVGGTTVMGEGNALSSVGVPSAQVDFNKGQPLAAAVAAALGVPVIALLSSPGATGGSYGAASTLDDPTLKGMRAEQDSWKVLYKEILADMGSPKAIITFPNISQDATYREAQTLAQGYATGAIFQEEYREAYTELVDVRRTKTGLPKPDAFNAGKDPADDSNPTPSQGNTGAVQGGSDQGVTNHDNDE